MLPSCRHVAQDLRRDATLHAVALGFVFSMIFGHAPIIFPAVLRVKIPWHPLACRRQPP